MQLSCVLCLLFTFNVALSASEGGDGHQVHRVSIAQAARRVLHRLDDAIEHTMPKAQQAAAERHLSNVMLEVVLAETAKPRNETQLARRPCGCGCGGCSCNSKKKNASSAPGAKRDGRSKSKRGQRSRNSGDDERDGESENSSKRKGKSGGKGKSGKAKRCKLPPHLRLNLKAMTRKKTATMRYLRNLIVDQLIKTSKAKVKNEANKTRHAQGVMGCMPRIKDYVRKKLAKVAEALRAEQERELEKAGNSKDVVHIYVSKEKKAKSSDDAMLAQVSDATQDAKLATVATASASDPKVTIGGGNPNATAGCQDKACAGKRKVVDVGFQDEFRGWYDVQECGQCNDYCRWVGEGVSGGSPTRSRDNGKSYWSCTLAGKGNDLYTVRGHFNSFTFLRCDDPLPAVAQLQGKVHQEDR